MIEKNLAPFTDFEFQIILIETIFSRQLKDIYRDHH